MNSRSIGVLENDRFRRIQKQFGRGVAYAVIVYATGIKKLALAHLGLCAAYASLT